VAIWINNDDDSANDLEKIEGNEMTNYGITCEQEKK